MTPPPLCKTLCTLLIVTIINTYYSNDVLSYSQNKTFVKIIMPVILRTDKDFRGEPNLGTTHRAIFRSTPFFHFLPELVSQVHRTPPHFISEWYHNQQWNQNLQSQPPAQRQLGKFPGINLLCPHQLEGR